MINTILTDFTHNTINKINYDLKHNSEIPNELLAFEWIMRYNENTSNKHSCPVEGVYNFNGSHDKPTGYPGFTGKITWTRVSLVDSREWIETSCIQIRH